MKSLYKIVRENYTDCYSGTLRFDVGTTVMAPEVDPATPTVCGRGIHACFEPMHTLRYADPATLLNGHLLLVEPVKPICDDGEKMRAQGVRVIEEVPLGLAYGPCGDDVIRFLRSLRSVPWLNPPSPVSESVLQQHVTAHIEALRPFGYTESVPRLRVLRAWAATRAAWYAAEAAAMDAAMGAAMDAAMGAAMDAARDAAWYAARAATRAAMDAARDAAMDAARAATRAAWYAARDAVMDAAWQVVADKMPSPNPFAPLMEIWRMGCCPVGVTDGEFLIYVPECAEVRA